MIVWEMKGGETVKKEITKIKKEIFNNLKNKPFLQKFISDNKNWNTYDEETKNKVTIRFTGEKDAEEFKNCLNQFYNQ